MVEREDMDVLEAHRAGLDAAPLDRDVDTGRVGAYRGYAEQLARWLALGRAGARVRVVGASAAGAPIVAVHVGAARPAATSILIGGLHPIEWIGVEALAAVLERLVQDPPRDRAIVAFPLVNVDGYRRVEADLRAGRRRWHRTNDRGVDLNRNWPTYHRGRGAPHPLLRWAWGGPHPLSEPEVAAVVTHIEEMGSRAAIDAALSLHSRGPMLLYPYGGRWQPPAAADAHRRAAAGIRQRLGRRYRVRQVSHWLPGALARGIEIDHLHARFGAVSLLVECSGGGLALRDPASWVHPFRWYNPRDPGRVAAELAEALEPFVRGAG